MGFWWKKADNLFNLPITDCYVDRTALPKNDYPLVWRYQHCWWVFSVTSDVPYYVFFTTKSMSMRTTWRVKTPQFAVRVGPEPIMFCALTNRIDAMGLPLQLQHERLTRMQVLELITHERASATLALGGKLSTII